MMKLNQKKHYSYKKTCTSFLFFFLPSLDTCGFEIFSFSELKTTKENLQQKNKIRYHNQGENALFFC